jgi:hypothetical protein
MAQFGQVRPELGRQDWSAVARGGEAYGAGVGQGLASLGASVGKAMDQHKQMKAEVKSFKDFISSDLFQSASGTEAEAVQDLLARFEDASLPEQYALAKRGNQFAGMALQTGMMSELQREQLNQLRVQGELDKKYGAEEREAGLRARQIANEVSEFQLDTLGESWQMKVDEHASRIGLDDLQKQKLGWEIHQLSQMDKDGGDHWSMPFEKMPADMKAAVIFHKDLGMDKDAAINAAYGLEGPSATEKIREMEALNFGGYPMMDLWRLTTMEGFNEKEGKDGNSVELSGGKRGNRVEVKLSKSEYDTFKRMRDRYSEQVGDIVKTDVDKLKDKYVDGSTATFGDVTGTIQHAPDGVFLVTSEGRRRISE